jgi:phosphoribosylformylglycinamidine synthase
MGEDKYNIVAKYGYEGYPANPNGSDFNTAMLCDSTGRHLVMMPHIERSTFQWNWALPKDRNDEVSPWHEAFVNAKNGLTKKNYFDLYIKAFSKSAFFRGIF